MKTLILVRHAKSSWDDMFMSDFDRPLNERGKTDAPKMGKRLANKDIKIDAFVSSPAKRAKKTAKAFIKEFKKDEGGIIYSSALYDASVKDFYDVVKDVDDKFESAALFSHNPGITAFANDLIKDVNIDNMPTCSVFAVEINSDNWKDFAKAKKEFLFFDFPKKED